MQYAHDELFPSKYAKEIEGIAEGTGISVADLSVSFQDRGKVEGILKMTHRQ